MGKKTGKKSNNIKNNKRRTTEKERKSEHSSGKGKSFSDKEYSGNSSGKYEYEKRGYSYGGGTDRDYRYSGYKNSGTRGYTGYSEKNRYGEYYSDTGKNYERNDKYKKSYSYDNRGAGKQYSYGRYSYEGTNYERKKKSYNSADDKYERRNGSPDESVRDEKRNFKKKETKSGKSSSKKRKGNNRQNQSGKTVGKQKSQSRSGANTNKRGNNAKNIRKKGKKKHVVKKRFYVFLTVFILLIAALIVFSIKTAVNLVMIYSAKPETQNNEVTTEQAKDPGGEAEEQSQDETDSNTDNADSADEGTATLEDEYGNTPAVMTTDPVSDSVDEQGNPVYNNLSQEQQIRNAILTGWYMYPLGQQRSTVEIVFGKLIRYEDWNGRIYYHRGFPDTMYVTYDEQLGDDGLPLSTSICTGVNIALEKMIGFEPFTPGADTWGKVYKDESGKGWTDYYYYVLIRDNLTMKVYCDKDGVVRQSSHVKVKHL